MKAVNRP